MANTKLICLFPFSNDATSMRFITLAWEQCAHEATVAYLRYCLDGPMKATKHFSDDDQPPARELIPGLAEYRVTVLSRFSINFVISFGYFN